MKIHLHIGAHKTATTHLQTLLRRNNARLHARGVACFGPEKLRGEMKLPNLCVDHPSGPRRIAPLGLALQQADARGQRLVISEENILGTTRSDIIANGVALYPDAHGQVARFLTLIGAHDVTLYLAVRHPLSFVNSAYGQQIKGGNLIAFDHYINGFDPAALRWSELVARLAACPTIGRLVLWRYEDYEEILPDILAQLLGGHAVSGLRVPGAPRQVGSSARAVEHARARLRADPALSPKAAISEAEGLFPKSDRWPGAQNFTPAQLATGDETYSADLRMVRSLPKVTFLRPSSRTETGA